MLNFDELAEMYGYDASDPEVQELTFVEQGTVPLRMTDAELWKNYTDDKLYQLDKKMRVFIKGMRRRQEGRGGFKVEMGAVFIWMFGHAPTPHDSYICRRLHQLLRYYCTSYTGKSAIAGKSVPHVYHFSKYQSQNKRPFSIKLRLEELDGNITKRTLSEYGEFRDKQLKTLRSLGYDGRKDGYDSYKGRNIYKRIDASSEEQDGS